jgi:crossover junction endodeoxyribonuclease RuvC
MRLWKPFLSNRLTGSIRGLGSQAFLLSLFLLFSGVTLEHMFVLGIDPGLTRTGYGVLKLEGRKMVAVAAGVISTDPKVPTARRLFELQRDLTGVLEQYQVEVMAIERVFFRGNKTNAMTVSQASGVAMACGAAFGVAVHEYTPSAIKFSVAGDGTADKDQLARAVVRRLNLVEAPKPADAADALAVALCHTQHVRFEAVS